MKQLFPSSQLSEIKNQVADYEFEEAVKTLKKLRQQL